MSLPSSAATRPRQTKKNSDVGLWVIRTGHFRKYRELCHRPQTPLHFVLEKDLADRLVVMDAFDRLTQQWRHGQDL